MPATAGRVRMPANNRVHSSAALQTHGIWQSAIGYDPYAPTNKDKSSKAGAGHSGDDDDTTAAENPYASFQGLLALAKITGSNSNETRGACKKCGRVGHLTYQCRNFLSIKDAAATDKDKDDAAIQAAANAALEKIKKSNNGLKQEEESEVDDEDEDDEDSESSDSDVDPEMEKIIASRFGKKWNKKASAKEDDDSGGKGKRSHSRRGRSKRRSEKKRLNRSDESDSKEGERSKEKRRRRHRNSDDDKYEDDGVDERRHKHRNSRKDKKRRSHRRDDCSDSGEESEEETRGRRHHKQWSRRRVDSGSDFDSSGESPDDRKRSGRHHAHQRKRRAAYVIVSESDKSNAVESSGRKERKRSDGRSSNSRLLEKN